MGELRAVPNLLARSDRSFARTQRRMRTIKGWVLAIAGSIYIASLVFFAIGFIVVWHGGGDWLEYWASYVGIGSLGIGVARFSLWRDARADLFAPVAALRQAIRNGDAAIAPVAETAGVRSHDTSTETGQIGPLRRPAATGTVVALWGTAVPVLLVPGVGVPLAVGAGNCSLAPLLAAAGLVPGLVCLLLGWRLSSPLFVRVGSDGLRWRRPIGLTAFIAWRDAQAFFSLTYALPGANDRETLHVLDGGSATLAWRTGAETSSGAPRPAFSPQLERLITECTGLPLRDVSAQAKRIAQKSGGGLSQTIRRAGTPVSTSRLSNEEIRHRMRVAGVVLSPYLLLVLVSLIAMLVQAPYYEHQYAQAQAHSALYRDPLSHPDGDWPENAFAHFENGSYRLELPANRYYLTYVAAPHRYDHALVEVSGRTGGTFDIGGVGFAIVGPDSSTPLLALWVAPAGEWWIERLPTNGTFDSKSFIRFGELSAIHKGFGVFNYMAVLVNGADFTFFVNGHFAASYHDDALKGGQVCLYVNSFRESGDFSNFAVYPL